MKKIVLFSTLLFFSFLSQGQKQLYTYMQAGNGKPFLLRMNEKVYKSTASGYLILAPLADSSYAFQVRFAGSTSDISFAIDMKAADHGYEIKDLGQKGWALFDLQSLSVIQGRYSGEEQNVTQENGTVNAFTEMLSKAANDPSLKHTTVLVKDKTSDKQANVQRKDVVEASKANVPETETIKQPLETKTVDENIGRKQKDSNAIAAIIPSEKQKDTAVNKVMAESQKKEITETAVVNQSSGMNTVKEQKPLVQKDTVVLAETIFVDKKNENNQLQADKEVLARASEKNAGYKRSVITKTAPVMVEEGVAITYMENNWREKIDTIRIIIPRDKTAAEVKEVAITEKKFLDISNDATQAEAQKEPAKTVIKSETACKSVAADDDFLKLRRKMAARTNDDGMIEEASKYFKSKCFTADQVKNLGSLFLSDAGRYNFYKIAYEYVSNKNNFPALRDQLSSKDYQLKFESIYTN